MCTTGDCIYIVYIFYILKYSAFGIYSDLCGLYIKACHFDLLFSDAKWLPVTWQALPKKEERFSLGKKNASWFFSPSLPSFLHFIKWLTKINNIICSLKNQKKQDDVAKRVGKIK